MPDESHVHRLLVTQGKALDALGFRSKTTLRKLILEGQLDARRVGNLKMITWASIEAYVAALPTAQSSIQPAHSERMKALRAAAGSEMPGGNHDATA